jgi:hypothetical protein
VKFFNRDGKLVDPPTRRLKFTDNSGHLYELAHANCPTHDAAAEKVPKLHLWFHPTTDASAGAWGEQKAGYASGENPRVPMQRGAREDPFRGPRETGGAINPGFDQGTPPSPASVPSTPSGMALPDQRPGWAQNTPELDEFGNCSDPAWNYGPPAQNLIDARSIRVTGRDQNGKMWNAAVWGGSHPQQGEGSSVAPVDPEMRRTGDRMLRDLEHGGDNMIAGLRVLQVRLNAHYRR